MTLLVFKTNSPRTVGYRHGLGVSANMVADVLTIAGEHVQAIGVFDGFELEDILRTHEHVRRVVFYAPWIDIKFLAGLAERWPQVRFTVTLHSNLAFLQSDAFAMKIIRQGTELSKAVPNFTISSNNPTTAEFIEVTYEAKCPYLPNLYLLDPDQQYMFRGCQPKLRLGLFGATRQLKNLMTGVGAGILVSKMRKPVQMFISGGRVEGGEGILRAIYELVKDHRDFQLEIVDWMEWPDFTRFVGTMDLLVQPSFSESFNNVVADGAAQFIAAAVGPAITWAPESWKVRNPDNVVELAERVVDLVEHPAEGLNGRGALEKYVRDGIAWWKGWIRGEA